MLHSRSFFPTQSRACDVDPRLSDLQPLTLLWVGHHKVHTWEEVLASLMVVAYQLYTLLSSPMDGGDNLSTPHLTCGNSFVTIGVSA